jgi:DNA-binding transcriptional ArsR family regulator
MAYGQALTALADPSRRTVFEKLWKSPASVGVLAATMSISRPSVSQHLKVLKDSGLVVDEAHGTRRIYRVDPRGLASLRAWLDQFWDEALVAFKADVERTQKKKVRRR